MSVATDKLQDELHLVAEYARFPEHLRIEVREVQAEDECEVILGDATYRVSTSWCMGNIRRLHDRCSVQQMRDALYLSHPDRKGVSSKQQNPDLRM